MAAAADMLSVNHLLSICDMTRQDIEIILKHTRVFSEINQRDLKKVPFLRGHTVAILFFEASTRTRVSFELAAKRLSADIINLNMAQSSMSKGESILDTVRTILAMKPTVIIVRHGHAGVPQMIAQDGQASVLNAGDGMREHPSQALLDAYTLMEHLSRSISEGLEGIHVAIGGDILHSRVARSNILCLQKLGARISIVAPKTLIPKGLEGVATHSFWENLDAKPHAIMMLRTQRERMSGQFYATDAEFLKYFGLDQEKQSRLFVDVPIMHPGPFNRGSEIDDTVADGKHSLILNQVENGVATRMAMLYALCQKRLSDA